MKAITTFRTPEFLQQELRNEFPQVDFSFHKHISFAEKEIKQADIIITYGEDLTNQHLTQAKSLKWIMVASAGLDKLPAEIIEEREILVTNARGIHKIPMAEFTLGLMLQHVKMFKTLWKQEEEVTWYKKLPVQELYGKTIMIVGAGAIGREIARLANAFRMNVIGVNSDGRLVEGFSSIYRLDQMVKGLPAADFVISVLPSTEKTRYIYEQKHFAAMKTEAVFINVGRGDVVEEEVLIEALNNKEISHAFIDVFEVEPLPANHPFWTMENITVTPHISSHSKNYLVRAIEIFKKNLHTYLNGGNNYINVVDLKRGY